MIKSGIVSATFRKKTPEEIISLANEAGLSAVEWSEDCHVFSGDAFGSLKLRDACARAGLEIAAYGSYYRLGTADNIEEAFVPRVISAEALGAPLIRVWAGGKPSAEVGAEEFGKLAGEASIIAGIADLHGIKVAFEWHRNTLTDTNESAAKLLAAANHPNLYCLWQPTPGLTEEQREAGLRQLGDRLLNLHVYYWEEGKRRPLSEGSEYWKRYFSNADTARDRYALLEFVMDDTREQFLEDARTLLGWLKDEPLSKHD